MPETLEIKPRADSPELIMNPNNNIFKIVGMSFMEDGVAFYKPVLEWLDEYIKAPNPETKLVINLKYFNSVSSLAIFNILEKFRKIHENGKNVLISWHYQIDENEMEEVGKEYAALVDIPFEFISDKI